MRKLYCFVLAFALSANAAWAQFVVSDVLNIAHLTQLISQVYATYDSIMATIEGVQNAYQQLEKQIKMLETVNWDDITNIERYKDMDFHQGFLEFRNHYKDSIAAIDRNMTMVTNIFDTFDKKQIKFAGKNYTLGGLFGTPSSAGYADRGTSFLDLPNNAWGFVKESAKEGAAGYAGKLTPKQREAIMRKYGMSPQNYYNVRLVEQEIDNVVDQLFTWTPEGLKKTIERAVEDNKAIQEMTEIAGESVNAQIDIINQNLNRIPFEVTLLRSDMKDIGKFLSANHVAEMARNEARAEQALNDSLSRMREEQLNRAAIQMGNF
jgi:prefoldin subunit 5